jgi:integrase
LTRHSKGWKVRYRVYFPDGHSQVKFVYRVHRQPAADLQAEASQLERLTQQNVLRREAATAYQHLGLLTAADLAQWFPTPPVHPYDAGQLLDAYERQCVTRMTGARAIEYNLRRARALCATLGDLSRLTLADVTRWQEDRARQVARKTVNLEHDVLRQLLDLCEQTEWSSGNVARRLRRLSWKPSRLPQALTVDQVARVLTQARAVSAQAAPWSSASQVYPLLVAGLYFGLRRGELAHLLASDTDGHQVIIQRKRLPEGPWWAPKDREWRVVYYRGIERPLAVVFGDVPAGYLFSPVPTRDRPWYLERLSRMVAPFLRPLGPGLSLHSLRHTFATWRLEAGDSILQVKGLLGHADANTLLRYAHIHPNPMTDLLGLLDG